MQKQASSSKHEPSHIDLDVYREIEDAMSRPNNSVVDASELAEISSLLYEEARLLDQRKYQDWLSLFTRELIYWIPAGPDAMSIAHHCAVNFDDRRRLTDRISLIESGALHAQLPASRTARLVGNISAWNLESGIVRCHSVLMLSEFRNGVISHYAGHQEHMLAREGDTIKITRKVISLLNGDEPIGNTTFIL